jgi:hypothetical protein
MHLKLSGGKKLNTAHCGHGMKSPAHSTTAARTAALNGSKMASFVTGPSHAVSANERTLIRRTTVPATASSKAATSALWSPSRA